MQDNICCKAGRGDDNVRTLVRGYSEEVLTAQVLQLTNRLTTAMKIYPFIFLLTVFVVSSVCGQSDILMKMKTDDYPVTNEMLTDKTSNNSSYKKRSGDIYSLDKAWFTNDTIKQTLVFELYTDYQRLHIYHFYNNDIPDDLIKQVELYVSKSKYDNVFDSATFQQKQAFFNGFIGSAIKINQSYFTTKKGFKLGDKKVKATDAYGKPDSCSISNEIERCHWKFEGDYIESEEVHPKLPTTKPFAENSLGFDVTMYFRKSILIAMILSNDIP